MTVPNAASVALVSGDCRVASADVTFAAKLTGDKALSTSTSYVFRGNISTDASGEYAICLCEDASYTLTVQKLFSATSLAPAARFAADLCAPKCSPGCLGTDCECDGWDPSDEGTYGLTAGPLCLSAARCREACDATAGCVGYSVSVALPRCFLASGPATAADPAYESFTKAGATCEDAADFVVVEGSGDEVTLAQKAADITLG